MPSLAEFQASLGLPDDDASSVRCYLAAEAWARKCLGRAAGASLADLTGDNAAALYAYAADLLKLPKASFGMFGPDDLEGLQVVAGDIGRRWSGQLTFGVRTGVSFA